MNRNSLYSGLLGGLVVAVIFAILLATGVIDAGNDTQAPRPTIAQLPDRPAADQNSGSGGKTVSDIYDQDGPGVAFVQTQESGGGLGGGGEATGSGFVIDKKGDIVTNNHVVD